MTTATTFEDLPIKKFIAQLKSIGSYTISAQADGLTFYFGIDSDGQFYTSAYSPNKRTKFSYKVTDYQLKVENNQFRAAHKAISKFSDDIKGILDNGQVIECQLEAHAETQFGNTFSKIILVRPVIGEATIADAKVIDTLYDAIGDKKAQVKVKQVTSINGEDLEEQEVITTWKVTKTKSVKGDGMLSSSKMKSILSKLQDFLSKDNEVAHHHGMEFSNYDVASINLTQVPMKYRDVIETERDKLNKLILTKYKFPIKTELLKSIEDSVGSQAALLHKGSDSTWIASSEFKADGRFDTIPKRELSGMIRTTDKKATLEDRGGIEGVFQQRMAGLFGVPELQRPQSVGKVFKTFRGTSPRDTAAAFAQQFKEMSFNGVKTKVLAVLKYSKEQAQKKLQEFKDTSNDFKQVTGESEITYTQDEIKDNLGFYAQAINGYDDRMAEVGRSKSFTDLILALYGNAIYSLHGQRMAESIIEEGSKLQNVSLDQIKHMHGHDICSAYTATLLASMLLLRTQTKGAVPLIKDMKHSTLKHKPDATMSQLNFWGTMVFSPYIAAMKDSISPETTSELKKLSGRITKQRVEKIHKTLSSGSFVQDWDLQEDNAKMIAMRLETRSQSINTAIAGIRHWDDIELSDKNTVIAKVFYYLQQHVHGSPLLGPLRQLASNTLTHAAVDANKTQNKEGTDLTTDKKKHTSLPEIGESLSMIQELSSLVSEAEMGANAAQTAISNGANIPAWADFGVATDPSSDGQTKQNKASLGNKSLSNNHLLVKFMNGKPIVRRKRDFIKKPKFTRNTDQIVREDGEGGGEGGAEAGDISSGAIATFPSRLFDTSDKKKGQTNLTKTPSSKKKKRILKRVIPGFKHLTAIDEVNNPVAMFSDLYYAIVEWTDEDFTGDPSTDEGFKFLKEERYLLASLVANEKEGDKNQKWPSVKLIGTKEHLTTFLSKDYQADATFIASAITPMIGE